jgi:chemotaxis protein methyltransferase CheR
LLSDLPNHIVRQIDSTRLQTAKSTSTGMMDKSVFKAFAMLVYDKAGISLGESKEALVSSRVAKRMRTLGIEQGDYKTYLKQIEDDRTGEELVHFLDAISTNVTSFFRENHHFGFMAEVLSKWLAKGQKSFRIWSAACSSGEEPYSAAITFLEVCGKSADLKILATDISTKVLDKALKGIYEDDKVKTVPPVLRSRYFTKVNNGSSNLFEVVPALKQMVVFKRLNLSTPPFPMRGPLDIVFCRNVMIYFDNAVRTQLLSEIYRLLKPGGYLFVGHAESLTGIVSDFKVVKPATYIKQ